MFRIVTIVYLQHVGAQGILDHRKTQRFTYDPDDPMQSIKVLGLNLGKSSGSSVAVESNERATVSLLFIF